jgi:signal transduction histidine kinase
VRLHSRIYLNSLLVLLIVVLTVTAVFAVFGRGGPPSEIASRVARHAASLAGEVVADPPRLAARLQRLHADLGVDVAMRDLSGRVVASAGDELPDVPADMQTRARQGRVVTRLHPVAWALAPVRDGSGAVVGTVAVVVHRHFGPPRLTGPLLVVAVVWLVVAAATRPLARRLARPIERLTEAARRVAAGELSARVPDASRCRHRGWRRRAGVDEIQELTRTFNDMAERVERLVQGQKELVANVSHELRSPLARIRVALELLPRTPDAERRFTDLEADLAELDRLIEDVLATARLDATGLPTELAPVDVRGLLARVAERARHDPLTQATEVRVVEGPPVSILGDERLLRRTLWNLVENAGKYGAPPVTLAAHEDGERVIVTVSDAGLGVPAEAREQVFEPFHRLDAARTPGTTRGVGLGLTFARRVAEAHGGTILIGPETVADGHERGCRITLTLPA